MTTLTIEIPDKVEKTLAALIEQLGGKVISTGEKNKIKKKKQILNDLSEAVNFVKLHQGGKVKAKSIEELIDEL